MSKIIGIANTHFTPKDSDKAITGKTFYTTEPMDPKRGEGETADHFFLTNEKLAALNFTPAVGQTVDVLYNRYGRIATVKLVDDDNLIVV